MGDILRATATIRGATQPAAFCSSRPARGIVSGFFARRLDEPSGSISRRRADLGSGSDNLCCELNVKGLWGPGYSHATDTNAISSASQQGKGNRSQTPELLAVPRLEATL